VQQKAAFDPETLIDLKEIDHSMPSILQREGIRQLPGVSGNRRSAASPYSAERMEYRKSGSYRISR
jgi:hypothetical protein